MKDVEKDKGLPVLKMLLTVITLAAFWWFGSSGGESSWFHKVFAAVMSWQLDIILEILGVIGAILLGITVVFMKAQVMTVPLMKPLTDPDSWTPVPKARDSIESELQELGFRFIGDFDAAMSSDTSMRIRAYSDPDRLVWAILMDGKSGSEKVTILEFSTKLLPAGSIVTNTSPYPVISSYPLEKCVVRVPWKKTAKVFELHKALYDTAVEEGFAADAMPGRNFADEVIKATRKDQEYQVETGRSIKVADDKYRMSLKGVAIAVPRLWLNMTYSFLFSWFKPSDGYFKSRIRRRLSRFMRLAEEAAAAAAEKENGDDAPPAVPLSSRQREAPKIKL